MQKEMHGNSVRRERGGPKKVRNEGKGADEKME